MQERHRLLGEFACGESFDDIGGFVLATLRVSEGQARSFELNEHAEVTSALVAVGEWVIANDPRADDCGALRRVRIEVCVSEAHERCRQGRLRRVEPRGGLKRRGIYAEHALCNKKEVG